MKRSLWTALPLLALAFAVPSASVWAQKTEESPAQTAPSKGRYVAAQTRVAILPVANRAGTKDETHRLKQTENAQKTLAEEFSHHGFVVVDPEIVNKVIAEAKFDIEDEEEYRKVRFYELGKAAGADLVIFVAIVEARRQDKRNLFSGVEVEGVAKIKTWFLDVQAETPILNGTIFEAKAAGQTFLGPINQGGSERIANAVSNAAKRVLEPFMKDYPPIREEKKKK